MSTKPIKDILTDKERILVKEMGKGKSGTKAAMVAYNASSPESAAAMARDALKKPRVQKALKALGERFTDDMLFRRHRELLDKRDTTTVYDYEEDPDTGERKQVARLVDAGPDTQAVTKGLDMAYRLRGLYKDKPEDKGEKPVPILANIQINMPGSQGIMSTLSAPSKEVKHASTKVEEADE